MVVTLLQNDLLCGGAAGLRASKGLMQDFCANLRVSAAEGIRHKKCETAPENGRSKIDTKSRTCKNPCSKMVVRIRNTSYQGGVWGGYPYHRWLRRSFKKAVLGSKISKAPPIKEGFGVVVEIIGGTVIAPCKDSQASLTKGRFGGIVGIVSGKAPSSRPEAPPSGVITVEV